MHRTVKTFCFLTISTARANHQGNHHAEGALQPAVGVNANENDVDKVEGPDFRRLMAQGNNFQRGDGLEAFEQQLEEIEQLEEPEWEKLQRLCAVLKETEKKRNETVDAYLEDIKEALGAREEGKEASWKKAAASYKEYETVNQKGSIAFKKFQNAFAGYLQPNHSRRFRN